MRDWFRQEVVGAVFHRLFHIRCGWNAGEHDNRKTEILVAYLLEGCNPILARHRDVQNDQSRCVDPPGKRTHYLLSVFGKVNDEVGSPKSDLQVVADLGFIVRYENTMRRG